MTPGMMCEFDLQVRFRSGWDLLLEHSACVCRIDIVRKPHDKISEYASMGPLHPSFFQTLKPQIVCHSRCDYCLQNSRRRNPICLDSSAHKASLEMHQLTNLVLNLNLEYSLKHTTRVFHLDVYRSAGYSDGDDMDNVIGASA